MDCLAGLCLRSRAPEIHDLAPADFRTMTNSQRLQVTV